MAGKFGSFRGGDRDHDPGNPFGETTRHLLAHLQARVLLFAVETREAFRELSGRSACQAVGAMLLFLGYLLVLVCVVPLAAEWLHTRWQFVGLGVAALHFAAGGLVFWFSHRRFSAPLYELTLSELEKDRQWIAGNHPASPGK